MKENCSLLKSKNIFNAFKRRIFPTKTSQQKGLKIFALQQKLQRLLIALAQFNTGNTF